ncbi:MAG: hypothetical protein L0Z07_02630, partial [Planctomycetes bacterium]|nr:hypothetical protein [Planctomycetota bacterium]
MASAITEDFATCQPQRPLIWHRSAPRRLIDKSRPEAPLAGWTTWQKHLARRKSPQVPHFFAGKEPALLWGWPKNWTRDELADEIGAPEAAASDFSSISADSLDLSHALQAVGLAYALPRLAGKLTADPWWRLAKSLATLATDAGQHRVDWLADPRDVVRNQLLAGELPLVLGYLFPELTICRALRNPAREALSEALVAVTDGKGLPHARLLPVLGALFACWTRCRWLGERMKRGCWSREAEVQYLWLVRQAIRLANGRGQFLFGENDDSPGAAALHPLFTTALELVGDHGDCALAAAMISKSVLPRGMKPRKKILPKPALDSTWSGIAILTSNWSKSAARLA